ncbi:MAG: YkuS family protein [Clostridia bacterium]|nr:YkuS family protein [Clostridia bacterium]
MKNIAIQKGLDPIKDYFEQKGYKIQEFENNPQNAIRNFDDYDNLGAIIITGSNENLLGMQDTLTKVPIINARGVSPEDIEKRINNSI